MGLQAFRCTEEDILGGGKDGDTLERGGNNRESMGQGGGGQEKG